MTVHRNGQRKWEQLLGLAPGELEKMIFESDLCDQASMGLIPESEYWNTITGNWGVSDRADELKRDFFGGDIINQDLLAFILHIRTCCKIGIITNAWSDARQNIILKTGIDKWADTIIISAEVGMVKPSPEIFWLCLNQLGMIQPSQAAFVDDRLVNIKAAIKLGIHGIHFCNTQQSIKDIARFLEEKC